MESLPIGKAGEQILQGGGSYGPFVILLIGAVVILMGLLLKSYGDRIKEATQQTVAMLGYKETNDTLETLLAKSELVRQDQKEFTNEVTQALRNFGALLETANQRRAEQFTDMKAQFQELKTLLQQPRGAGS